MLPPDVTDLTRLGQGVVTRPQLLALGYPPDVIDGWVRRGHLEHVVIDGVPLVGTYRVRGGAETPQQAARAAVARCRPKSALSGPVMLGAHGIEGFDWDSDLVVRVPVDRWVSGVPFTVLRDPHFDRHREEVDGLPGSSMTRAILDTALTVHGRPLVTAIDAARWRRGTSTDKLRRCATALAADDHAGGVEVLRLLDSGELEQESHGERAMRPVLATLGFSVSWQVWVTPTLRVDAKLDDVPVVIEYLGEEAHSGSLRRAKDEARHRELLRLRMLPIYVVKADLARPDVLHARIATAREALLLRGPSGTG
jgi:hypothetical protein